MKPLKEGNIYCKECNGNGTIELSYKRCSYGSSNDISVENLVCPQCHGDGQFDWIEQVVGKHKTINSGYFYYKDIKGMYPNIMKPYPIIRTNKNEKRSL